MVDDILEQFHQGKLHYERVPGLAYQRTMRNGQYCRLSQFQMELY